MAWGAAGPPTPVPTGDVRVAVTVVAADQKKVPAAGAVVWIPARSKKPAARCGRG